MEKKRKEKKNTKLFNREMDHPIVTFFLEEK